MKKLLNAVKISAKQQIDRFKATPAGGFFFRFGERCVQNNIFNTGAQLAYHLLLSFFPLLIFILSLLSFTALGRAESLSQILAVLPDNASQLLKPVLLDLVDKRSGTLLSVSLVLALWSGSAGVRQVILAMDRTFEVDRRRPFFALYGLSILVTLILTALVLLILASQVFGTVIRDFIVSQFDDVIALASLWTLLAGLLPVVLIMAVFTLFYYLVPAFPAGERVRFRFALAGGITAGLGWLLVSFGFRFYVNRFANYASTYGSLGGIIVLLIWLYLNSVIIMVGAEVTAALVYQSDARQKAPDAGA